MLFRSIAVLGPTVEQPVRVSDFAGMAAHADGAGVAHPAAIGGDAEEIDGAQIYAGFFQDVARIGFRGAILDEEKNTFDASEMTHYLRIGPGNGGKFTRPVGFLVGPAEPSRFVMLPFGGHPETTFKGSGTSRD